MGNPINWNPINSYGQPKEAEHKVRRVRKTAKLEGIDATYGVSLHHPDGEGYWLVYGIAGTAGNYSIDHYDLRPETFLPGQQFRFRLPQPLKTLDIMPEGMLSGWLMFVQPISEKE
ncbi:hypothetical protein OAK65_02625 [Synechococcus sp. AH-551-N17]|nr:hypothetical protein [Synechococcus sp. AH-551-N17]